MTSKNVPESRLTEVVMDSLEWLIPIATFVIAIAVIAAALVGCIALYKYVHDKYRDKKLNINKRMSEINTARQQLQERLQICLTKEAEINVREGNIKKLEINANQVVANGMVNQGQHMQSNTVPARPYIGTPHK